MTASIFAAVAIFASTVSEWSYVTAAYVVVIGSLVAYATWIILRGRRTGRRLPPDERRWTQ